MNDARITVDDAGFITDTIDAFRSGECELTGLALYYALERVTPLVEFHTMLREGPKNRDANGLQQSYGDHNRLLMLGLDNLVVGNLDWLRSRVDDPDVTDTDLRGVLGEVAALDLPRDALVALWLACALHDCGMLCGRGSYVDVEDGLVISHDVIEALCPQQLRSLAYFALHHHDYIKDVFLGEVPVSVITDELVELDVHLRATALAALGLVQVAGAASLGVGRLGAFRIAIFHRCIDGGVLDDASRETRIARLISDTPELLVDGPEGVETALDSLDTPQRDVLGQFLDSTSLHGWHRALAGTRRADRMDTLVDIATRARDSGADAVVLAPGRGATACVETALSGCRLLVTSAP
jgi:hypothetical protein